MKYMLLIYTDPAAFDPAEGEKIHNEYMAFTQEILDSGELVAGDPLEPAETATSVRMRNGKRTTTDGPFAETKEALGGFYLIDARDLDEAIETAAKIPAAKEGSIEVRPIWELPAEYAMAEAAASEARAGG
jgi:hypothetical protein